jgi:hypothetical protein
MEQLSLFDALPVYHWQRVISYNPLSVDFCCPVCGYTFHNGEMTSRYSFCPGCHVSMVKESCNLV